MLDFERFRRVHKPVNWFTCSLGIVLGATVVLVAAMIPVTKLMPVYLLTVSTALGIVYVLGVHARYRVVFKGGVPWPPDSKMISPGNYWRVTRHYFWRFATSLGTTFAIFLAMYLIV